MANTNIRDLKVFEFNRALSYVSEILEIKRKDAKLKKEKDEIGRELDQWFHELYSDFSPYTEDENSNIRAFIDSIKARIVEIDKEREDLEKYEKELNKLVKKVLEFVIVEGEYFALTKEEIQESFAEECIYILTEIKDIKICILNIFERKTDLIFLLYDVYGREQEKLISDIVDANPKEKLKIDFWNYFPFE